MCFLALTNAQLTITYESLPQPGDTFAMRYTDNPILNIGTPQSSIQHFDFTNLENDSMKFATYGITANLSFAAEYPESNLYTWGPSALYGGPGSPVPGVGWGWMFFRTDEEGMSVVGYRTGESPNIVTNSFANTFSIYNENTIYIQQYEFTKFTMVRFHECKSIRY